VLAGHSVLPCLISPKRCNQKEIQAALHHYLALFQTFSSEMSQAGEQNAELAKANFEKIG